MAQKISYEDAFPTFQQKCSELFEANMLLQAQVDVQERQIAALTEENERLKQSAPDHEVATSPTLSTQPPHADSRD